MKTRIILLLCALLGKEITEKLLLNYSILKNGNKELKYAIKNNRRFKDTHKGERCFILGNGPSLKDVDLNMLAEEFVFSVNNFSMVQDYKKAKTNVHLWADLSFFEMREDQKYNHDELMENYYKISEEKPICFLCEQAYSFVKKYELDNILDINYFRAYSPIDSKTRRQFDLSKALVSYSTVVQYAIAIAIYMGFKEIYLLGCDSTNIVSVINCAMNKENKEMHAYENDDVDKRYKELLKHWTMTEIFYDQYYLFEGYRTIKDECDKKGILLVNCSTNTLINEIPRMSLTDVLSDKREGEYWNNEKC